jgi:hypothetical protein
MATNLHGLPVGAPGGTGFWAVAGMYLVIQVGGTIPIPLWVVWQSKLGFETGTLTLVFARKESCRELRVSGVRGV